MLKKIFLSALIFLNLPAGAEIIAPALQYLREDYPSAFLTKEDYNVKLNTTTKYKLRCSGDIYAIAIGDKENLKAEENTEEESEKMLYEMTLPKDVIIKTKYETYTYMQIYTDNKDLPITVILSINSKNKVPNLINFGDCTMYETLD